MSHATIKKLQTFIFIYIVGNGCRVEMTTQQSNNNTIYFRCSVVQ